MKYYEIDDDKYIPGRWYLRMPRADEAGRGELFDVWRFSEGRYLTIGHPIRMRVKPDGIALDFSHAFGIPIVHRRVVALFERLGLQREVQFIPVEIEGQVEPYFILNALQIIRCIDEARCDEVFHWKPEDGEPDRVGQERARAEGGSVEDRGCQHLPSLGLESAPHRLRVRQIGHGGRGHHRYLFCRGLNFLEIESVAACG
jgi:hypothetical protein